MLFVSNPCSRGALKPVELITDRAKRYRAQKNAPPAPRRCHYCGSRQNVEVEHVDGFEEHIEPENLTWACRSCNTRKGVVFKNAGFGRRTRQYNPHYSFSAAAAGLAGRRAGAAARKAGRPGFGSFQDWLDRHVLSISEQPTASQVKDWRESYFTGFRQRNPTGGAHSLGQWLNAVLSLRGQGGTMELQDAIAMVHATPHAQRSEFADEIWQRRRARGTAYREEVPF